MTYRSYVHESIAGLGNGRERLRNVQNEEKRALGTKL